MGKAPYSFARIGVRWAELRKSEDMVQPGQDTSLSTCSGQGPNSSESNTWSLDRVDAQ